MVLQLATLTQLAKTGKQFWVDNKKVILIGSAVVAGVLITRNVVAKIRSAQKVERGNLTITDNEAQRIADLLLGAMDRHGTDNSTIFRLIEPLNKDDINLVANKFGTKPYGLTGKCSGLAAKLICHEKDLFGWLRADLGWVNEPKLRSVFEQKGVIF